MLNAAQLARYRDQLERLSDRVGGDRSAVEAQTQRPSGGQADGNITNAPMHLADMGTDEFLFDMNAALLANETYLMNEVLGALRRVDDGTYGTCERCEQPIGKERLDAIPYARCCVVCAAAQPTSREVNLNEGRPASPADTLAPEGEMDEDRRRKSRDGFTSADRPDRAAADVHAVGTAGGGTAFGGLAGTNEGHGDPSIGELQDAAGSGRHDADAEDESLNVQSSRAGGAVGGTPANKRVRAK